MVGMVEELVFTHAAWLCRAAGFDAAIVTKEGAGNADNDLMLKVDALEADGLTAVALYAELSGADGTGQPLVAGPRQGAVASTGNYDHRVKLPAVERAVGGARLDIAGPEASAAVGVPPAVLLGASQPLSRRRALRAGVRPAGRRRRRRWVAGSGLDAPGQPRDLGRG